MNAPPKEYASISQAVGHNAIIAGLTEDTEPMPVKCAGLPIPGTRHREDCATMLEIPRGQAALVALGLCCDACCKRYDYNRRKTECKEAWTVWMRDNAERYAHFSTDHPEYNKPAAVVMGKLDVSKNVILYGPTGTGKTFLMLQRLKMSLWKGRSDIRVLWADQLKRLTQQRYNGRELEPYEQASVLGIEELFGEDSAREAYTSFVRNLIDVRLRLNKPTIITTQLKSADVAREMDKYSNETKADSERREAILRRINESFVPIPTDRNFNHAETEALF